MVLTLKGLGICQRMGHELFLLAFRGPLRPGNKRHNSRYEGDPQRSLCKRVKVNPGFQTQRCQRYQILETSAYRTGTRPREIEKLEGQSHVPLVDTGHGVARSEMCPAWVWLCFVSVFLTIPSILPLGMVMCILCPCIMEVCKLQGARVKKRH